MRWMRFSRWFQRARAFFCVCFNAYVRWLIDSLTNCMIVKNYTATYSINANDTKTFSATDFGITPISGYFAYAIVGIIANSVTSNVTISRFLGSSVSSTVLGLKNNSNNAYSNSVASIYVLWVKNGFIKSE